MIPPFHWWRTVFWLIPAITVYTIVLGAVSLASTMWERDGRVAHGCARRWARLILVTTGVKTQVVGLDRVPIDGSYVFVSNHQSIYDIPILFSHLPFQLRIIAKASLGAFPVLGWHLRYTGHLLVDRTRPGAATLRQVGQLMRRRHSLIVFPEGTRSVDGQVGRFKRGLFLLAVEAGLPIVPVAVVGSRHVMKKGRLMTCPGEVELVVHDPIATTGLSRDDVTGLVERTHAAIASSIASRGPRVDALNARGTTRKRSGRLMFVAAIIAAGGRGERLGGAVHKQLRHVGGRTVLERSIEPFDRSDVVEEIVVVLPPELVASPPQFLAGIRTPVRLVAGGSRRQDSVAAGLNAAAPEADILVIHDAARPFCTPALVERTVAAAAESGAAIAAVAAQDTVKEGRVESGVSVVSGTLPRGHVFLAQTPQAFTRAVLEEAVAVGQSGTAGTDEAALAEHAGHSVRLVEGDPRNMKITTEADLEMAKTLASTHDRAISRIRVGLGYDLHRLTEGRRLVMGGVDIPSDQGLLGHSDADVVSHAVTDAILGAANAGDIGGLFPDDDPQWKDASSIDLLRRAAEVIHDRGFTVDNVDVVVITDWPKIRDHAESMRRNLGTAMGIDETLISLKGKTSEGVGAVGRREAIEVHAVALLSAL